MRNFGSCKTTKYEATVYIKGTKKQANERLAAGQQVWGVEFNMYEDQSRLLTTMPDGTVIKFWEKMSGGSPVAKSSGTWLPGKGKIV